MVTCALVVKSLSLSACSELTLTQVVRIRLNPSDKWEQGWRSGESARLAPVQLGFKPRCRRHMLVEFVVNSFLCSETFSTGYCRSPLFSKTNISKFQSQFQGWQTKNHYVDVILKNHYYCIFYKLFQTFKFSIVSLPNNSGLNLMIT